MGFGSGFRLDWIGQACVQYLLDLNFKSVLYWGNRGSSVLEGLWWGLCGMIWAERWNLVRYGMGWVVSLEVGLDIESGEWG